jgi:hypothetical protein
MPFTFLLVLCVQSENITSENRSQKKFNVRRSLPGLSSLSLGGGIPGLPPVGDSVGEESVCSGSATLGPKGSEELICEE